MLQVNLGIVGGWTPPHAITADEIVKKEDIKVEEDDGEGDVTAAKGPRKIQGKKQER